jgi:hypothetical protein
MAAQRPWRVRSVRGPASGGVGTVVPQPTGMVRPAGDAGPRGWDARPGEGLPCLCK